MSAVLYIRLKKPTIAFLIARSASGLPERENVVYEIETDLRAHGFGEDAIGRMHALHEHDMALVRNGGEGWNAYREELMKASAEPWFPLVRLPGKILEMNAENRHYNAILRLAEILRWRGNPIPFSGAGSMCPGMRRAG